MQDLVFTGFLDLLDERLNLEAQDPHAPYAHQRGEGQALTAEALRAYGRRLFRRFAALHPSVFEHERCALTYLEGLGGPQAAGREAKICTKRPGPDVLIIDYQSDRPLPDVCQGLIEGCLAHFGSTARCIPLPVIGGVRPRILFHVLG